MNIKTISSAGYNLWASGDTCEDYTGSGSIELEYGWQLAAIPIAYGYWSTSTHRHIHDGVTEAKFENYILDQITDVYGPGIVRVANTYLGDTQAFYSYVVGSTPTTSEHNWQLIYSDGASDEVSGFWIEIIGLSAPYTITWGEV